MRACLDETALDWELVVADDGSEDDTRTVVEELARRDGRVRLVGGPHRGKGAAVRRGMLDARGAWRFMADADLSMPPDNLHRFLAVTRRTVVPDVAIGSREAPGSQWIGEPWRRHVFGRAFNILVRLLAVPGVQDTQCGFKLFSAEAAEALFPHARIQGFAFDVEMLFLARRAGFDVREVGITWYCRVESRVTARRGAAAFVDILLVRWNAWRGRYSGLRSADTSSGSKLHRARC